MTISESVHRRTPDITTHDGRGLPIRQIAYLRKVAAGPVETLTTRQRHDVAGRTVEQWNPRVAHHPAKKNSTKNNHPYSPGKSKH